MQYKNKHQITSHQFTTCNKRYRTLKIIFHSVIGLVITGDTKPIIELSFYFHENGVNDFPEVNRVIFCGQCQKYWFT